MPSKLPPTRLGVRVRVRHQFFSRIINSLLRTAAPVFRAFADDTRMAACSHIRPLRIYHILYIRGSGDAWRVAWFARELVNSCVGRIEFADIRKEDRGREEAEKSAADEQERGWRGECKSARRATAGIGRREERGFRLKSILFQPAKLPLVSLAHTPTPPTPLPVRERASALAHARTHVRMHARIFVNNIRGNLIIFLLPRFNSERFFRFSSPRASPRRTPAPSSRAFAARSVVCAVRCFCAG